MKELLAGACALALTLAPPAAIANVTVRICRVPAAKDCPLGITSVSPNRPCANCDTLVLNDAPVASPPNVTCGALKTAVSKLRLKPIPFTTPVETSSPPVFEESRRCHRRSSDSTSEGRGSAGMFPSGDRLPGIQPGGPVEMAAANCA